MHVCKVLTFYGIKYALVLSANSVQSKKGTRAHSKGSSKGLTHIVKLGIHTLHEMNKGGVSQLTPNFCIVM